MLSQILQVFSVALTTGVAFFAIYSIRRRPPWINDFIEDGTELLLKPNAEGQSLFDGLTDRFAQKFAQSLRMSFLAQKSGEVRHQNALQGRVFEAVMDKSPEMKMAVKALEQFGLDDLVTPENMPALLQIAQKYGLFGMIRGNSPGSGHGENVM